MEDGNLITMPVHLVRIANIMSNGEPVVEFNCGSIKRDLQQQTVKARKDYVEDEDLQTRLSGYPPEVAEAVAQNKDWVQLNPENTFVLQDLKEDWMRYAVPMVATCLKSFSKKALISEYESAVLGLGACSFVHVTYGDIDKEIYADRQMLSQIQNVFTQAMNVKNGAPLATTNALCKAQVVQPELNDLFEDDHYAMVNSEILSAGGISGMIVSGISGSGSSFASAQISMQTAAIRIKQAKDNFCEMMNKINLRLNGVLPRSSLANIPRFTFPPVDLAGNEKFQKTCRELWEKGVVSTRTMLQTHGYDMDQELERKRREQTQETDKALAPPGQQESEPAAPGGDNPGGRPEMDDGERNSDPGKSQSGKQPKPSRPEGSQ